MTSRRPCWYIENNSEKVLWEFDSIIMQNLFDMLLLVCIPTWPSHHVSKNTIHKQGRDCTPMSEKHVQRIETPFSSWSKYAFFFLMFLL